MFELSEPPSDAISCVQFAPDTNFLLVSSWDNNVRLYDVQTNTLRSKYSHNASVLDCCFAATNQQGFSGSLDRTVKIMDFATGSDRILGSHDKAVRCVKYSNSVGLVLSGSWDTTVKAWDLRTCKCVHTMELPGKVFCMSSAYHRLVVGTNDRHVWVYDLRNMATPEQRRESSLKYQTRCIQCYPDGSGYALGSIEGRVAMEYFDPSKEAQDKKYAFKCHRLTDPANATDTAYPVNTIAFHPLYGTFGTGGCDGQVIMWDGFAKKRLQHPWKFPTSIASLSFNHTGNLLAVASSYTFEEGQKEHPPDAIFIRPISETDAKSRTKTQ